MSDFTPSPTSATDLADRRRASRLESANKARKSRGLRELTAYEMNNRDEMVLKYADLGPGPERDALADEIAKLDGRVDQWNKPTPMPRELLATRRAPAADRQSAAANDVDSLPFGGF